MLQVREIGKGCAVHGRTKWRIISRGDGTLRGYCRTCDYQRVKRRRRELKEILIREAGGRCIRCGYSKCWRALHFHHRDPREKEFSISQQTCKSIAKLRAEATKCDLLCANCHAEVEEENEVGTPGLEPGTSALSEQRSNH